MAEQTKSGAGGTQHDPVPGSDEVTDPPLDLVTLLQQQVRACGVTAT